MRTESEQLQWEDRYIGVLSELSNDQLTEFEWGLKLESLELEQLTLLVNREWAERAKSGLEKRGQTNS